MNKVLASIALMLVSLVSIAQDHCGFDHILQKQLNENPELKSQIEAKEHLLNKYMSTNHDFLLSNDEYIIPVVFHVVHLGEAEGVGSNISEAQILSGLQQLNDAFANVNGQGVDTRIRFQMATQDPNCNPTNGINRVDGRVVSGYETNGLGTDGPGGDEVTIKALSKWPNNSYMNIWVVTEINGNNGGSGTQGFAYLASATSSDVDGIVLMHPTIGTTGTASASNDDGTLIHEMGHALNLYHTFEGTGINSQGQSVCGTGCGPGLGDCCDDTEAHSSHIGACPTSSDYNSCTGSNYQGVQNNWMNYSNCPTHFTQDQKDRMRTAIANLRAGLLSSNGLSTQSISFVTPNVTCQPQSSANGLSGGVGGIMKVALGGKSFSSSYTADDNGYVDNANSCSNLIMLDAGQTYDFVTSVWANDHDVVVWIDFNNDGDFDDSGEQLLSTNVPGSAQPSVDYTYSITTPNSGITENTALRMRVYADLSSPTDACDQPTWGQIEDYPVIFQTQSSATPPVAEFSANNTSICVGETVTFTDASTNTPTSWSWSITGNESLTSTDQNPTITFNTSGVYQVALTATNTDGSDTETKTDYITVNDLPSVSFTDGSSATVSTTDGVQAMNVSPTGGTFTGNGVTGSNFDPASAGVGTHTITYSYTDPGTSCSASTTFTYTVTDGNSGGGSTPPVADFDANNVTICTGETITFSDLSTNSPTSWSWSITGNETLTSTEQNPTFTFSTSGSYEVSLTVSNSDGSDTETKTDYITVNELPTVSFTAGLSATVSTTDGLQALTGSPIGGTYTGTGIVGTDFDPANAGVGTHVITYTYTDSGTGCSASTDFEFVVTDGGSVDLSPVADFSISSNAVCAGNTIQLTDQSTNSPTSWLWSITGPTNYTSQDQNPTLNISIAGTYSVSLTVTNSSGNDNLDQTDIIVVNANPEININSIDASCYGSDDAMISVSVTNGTSGNQYSIGGLTQSSGIFMDLQASTYTVTVIDDNSCFTMDDIIISQPNQITGSSSVAICPGESTNVFGTMVSTAGEYSETFTSANGCDSTHTLEVVVNDLPEITFSGPDTITVGIESGITNIVSVSPTGGTFSGNGVFGIQFNPAFAGEGTHDLEYVYTDNFTGCTNSAIITYVVLGKATSIEDNQLNYTIHPNPTNGFVNITMDDFSHVNIYNSYGQLVRTSNELVIDLSTESAGMYILEVHNQNGYSSKQRIIKK